MRYTIRLETQDDYRKSEELTRKAFTNMDLPGREIFREPDAPPCDEHLLVNRLRKNPIFVPELDFVAEWDGAIVGQILYTRCLIEDTAREHELLSFGPLSVSPDLQKQGVGGALVRHSLEAARNLDFKGVIIFGHPEYYHRFGFVNAARYGITTPQGRNFDSFMALELRRGGLDGIHGRFVLEDVFHIDMDELRDFDTSFR